jgi:hypothetical protein
MPNVRSFTFSSAIRLHFVLGFFVIILAGCGPSVYPVQGEVQVDGKALPKGAVVFWPDAAKGNAFVGRPTGDVAEGRYKLMTEGRAGAPLGWYKVTVSGYEGAPDSTKPLETKNLISKKYQDAATTDLNVEVVASGGSYNLKVSKD